jgi:hypothetical protein
MRLSFRADDLVQMESLKRTNAGQEPILHRLEKWHNLAGLCLTLSDDPIMICSPAGTMTFLGPRKILKLEYPSILSSRCAVCSVQLSCTPFFPHSSGGEPCDSRLKRRFGPHESSVLSLGEHCIYQVHQAVKWQSCVPRRDFP